MGCGACVRRRHARRRPRGAAPTPVVARELRGCGTLGLRARRRATRQIVEIPSLGGRQVFIEDINDDGVAVGGETTADGNMHAIRYTDLGGVQDLGALVGFGAQSYASAIASDGAIGGHADRADGTGVFFGHRYTAKGGRTEICAGQLLGLGSERARAGGRAASGPRSHDLAGVSLLARRRVCARSGRWAGARSSASGISEAGVVVGNAQLEGAAEGRARPRVHLRLARRERARCAT